MATPLFVIVLVFPVIHFILRTSSQTQQSTLKDMKDFTTGVWFHCPFMRREDESDKWPNAIKMGRGDEIKDTHETSFCISDVH